jgi:hypothetical protein
MTTHSHANPNRLDLDERMQKLGRFVLAGAVAGLGAWCLSRARDIATYRSA